MEHGAPSVQRKLSEVPFPGMAGSSQEELGHHFMQQLILLFLFSLRKEMVTYPPSLILKPWEDSWVVGTRLGKK